MRNCRNTFVSFKKTANFLSSRFPPKYLTSTDHAYFHSPPENPKTAPDVGSDTSHSQTTSHNDPESRASQWPSRISPFSKLRIHGSLRDLDIATSGAAAATCFPYHLNSQRKFKTMASRASQVSEPADPGPVLNQNASEPDPFARDPNRSSSGPDQTALNATPSFARATALTGTGQANPRVCEPGSGIKVEIESEYKDGGSSEIEESIEVGCELPLPEAWGRVHSFESFSAVDGPGIRSVIFLQGCLRRCLFCANPDTWSPLDNCLRLSSKDIANRLKKNLPYYKKDGGVTLSGGEPMMQPHFSEAIFKEAHSLGITTVIDTAGYGRSEDWAMVLPHTDRVLLCAKAMDPKLYQELVGIPQFTMLRFAKSVAEYNVPLVLRWVLIPGMTDTDQEINALISWAKEQPTLVGLEILPYHNLGTNKWEQLNLKYPLEGMKPPSKQVVERVRKMINDAGLVTYI